MNLSLTITCTECNNKKSYELKRTINKNGDRVYEDYSSITDTIHDESFTSKAHPEEATIICENCGHTHDLSL